MLDLLSVGGIPRECVERETGKEINLIFLFPPRSHLVDRLDKSSPLQASDKSSFKVDILKV